MKLNNETLDAIKNRRYQLRPVRITNQKKRRLSGSDCDIGQILSRRISMGYSTIEAEMSQNFCHIQYQLGVQSKLKKVKNLLTFLGYPLPR